MTEGSVGAVIIVSASLIGIGYIAFWLYRQYRVARFRQDVFALRDALFDDVRPKVHGVREVEAAYQITVDEKYWEREGTLTLAHPAYRFLRSLMNGYIRFGHRLSLTTSLLFNWMLDDDERKWLKEEGAAGRWKDLMNNLDTEEREKLKTYRRKLDKLVIYQLVVGSPMAVVTVIPLLLMTVAVRYQVRFARRISRKLYFLWKRVLGDQVDEAALAMGEV